MTSYPVNDIELFAETYGDPADPAILLIHGAGASMLWWDAELCSSLAARGRFVIRYDQRDTGRSSSFPVGEPGYAMSDLAADAVALLDALGVSQAHIVAQSMSGGTALFLALDHPSHVKSLTLISTTTAAEHLPPPSPDMPRIDTPDFDDPAAVEEYMVASMEAESGSTFDEPAARALVRADMARAKDYQASLTNHFAMTFDEPRNGSFGDLALPVLVLHGDADPLLPLAHGEAVRDAVPGARFVVLRGMGHGLSAPYYRTFADELIKHTEE